jgi:hypothetical protein
LSTSEGKREFRYPVRNLAADYLRSAVGLATSAGLLLAQPALLPALILTAAAALFLVYFARTASCRQLTRIALDEAGISAKGPLGATIRWDSLRVLQLEYYSTRTDREEGWMQLKLRGMRSTMRIDSGIDGFAELVRAAMASAAAHGAAIDAASLANLEALGVPVQAT